MWISSSDAVTQTADRTCLSGPGESAASNSQSENHHHLLLGEEVCYWTAAERSCGSDVSSTRTTVNLNMLQCVWTSGTSGTPTRSVSTCCSVLQEVKLSSSSCGVGGLIPGFSCLLFTHSRTQHKTEGGEHPVKPVKVQSKLPVCCQLNRTFERTKTWITENLQYENTLSQIQK